MTSTSTNEELLSRYQNADYSAFDAFYRRNEAIVFNYLVATLKNRADAEEAFQDTFLRIHAAILTYDPSMKALPWVFSIARNTAIDALRKRRRLALDGGMAEISVEARADLELIAREALGALLLRLTDNERQLLESRFLQAKSFDEMAEEAKTSAANVRQRLSRLVRKLKLHGAP